MLSKFMNAIYSKVYSLFSIIYSLFSIIYL